MVVTSCFWVVDIEGFDADVYWFAEAVGGGREVGVGEEWEEGEEDEKALGGSEGGVGSDDERGGREERAEAVGGEERDEEVEDG